MRDLSSGKENGYRKSDAQEKLRCSFFFLNLHVVFVAFGLIESIFDSV